MSVISRWVYFSLILALLVPCGVSALATYNGGQIVITQPVPDDVLAAGGSVEVKAPINSLTAAGGMIIIDAPVAGDVVVFGGTVQVNDDIGGKIVAAGGNVNVNSRIGTNAIITGGQVNIGKNAIIGRDALISGGQVVNAGQVTGNLTVRAQSFENQGTAGNLDVRISEPRHEFSRILSIFGIIFTIGMLILGLVLLAAAPKRFLAVEEELRKSALIKIVVGFFAIIIALIVLIILSLTVVLLPLALVFWAVFFLALLFSTLFVSLALGRLIARYLKWNARPWQMFVTGFIVLNLIFRVPVAGIIIMIISVSLGFAAVFWTLHHHWDDIRGEKEGV
jgi:hypothetical protein